MSLISAVADVPQRSTALQAENFEKVEVDLSCEPRTVTCDLESEALEAHFITTLRKLGYPLIDKDIDKLDAAGLKAKSFVSCTVGKFNLVNDN